MRRYFPSLIVLSITLFFVLACTGDEGGDVEVDTAGGGGEETGDTGLITY